MYVVEECQTKNLYQLLSWSFLMSAYAMGDQKETCNFMFSLVYTYILNTVNLELISNVLISCFQKSKSLSDSVGLVSYQLDY